jgi:hypothetical protein
MLSRWLTHTLHGAMRMQYRILPHRHHFPIHIPDGLHFTLSDLTQPALNMSTASFLFPSPSSILATSSHNFSRLRSPILAAPVYASCSPASQTRPVLEHTVCTMNIVLGIQASYCTSFPVGMLSLGVPSWPLRRGADTDK